MPKLILGGAWTQILLNGEAVGLAINASYDEDWAVNPANVLNFLGPVDYDSQGYTCSVTLGTYLPETPGSGPWPDGGVKALADYLPTRSQVQSNDAKPNEFALLQFLNTATSRIVNQFKRCILASNGVQIAPNAYVTGSLRMMAIEREI